MGPFLSFAVLIFVIQLWSLTSGAADWTHLITFWEVNAQVHNKIWFRFPEEGAEVIISDLRNKGVLILFTLIARYKFSGASR